jgi:DNA-binding transcriptional regulator YiaG
MTTDNNNDGLEIPAHLKREPKAKPATKADALNITGATPGASQAPADEADATPRKRKAKDHRGQELGEYLKQNAAKAKKSGKAKAKAAPKAKAKAAKPAKAKATKSTPRKETKQALFIEAMRTAKGISITEAAERFGWQAHTVRGAVAGGLKAKLGLKVEAERDDKRGTVYRIK